MNETDNSNNEVVKVSQEAKQVELLHRETLVDIAKFSTQTEMLSFFEMLVRSGRTGAKTKEEALAIYVQAKELGLGFTCASTHMHVVDGKPGIDIHIIRALLLKAGTNIGWKVVEDYVPLYKYIDSSNVEYTTNTLPEDAIVCNCEADVKKATIDGKLAVFKPRDAKGQLLAAYDYRSTINFFREIKLDSGRWITLNEVGTFNYSDAIAAGLVYKADNTLKLGSAWVKYPKNQLYTRAFTFGARKIASDVLLGMYETTELYDMTNTSYNLGEDGTISKI
jgi:hypothetical protein